MVNNDDMSNNGYGYGPNPNQGVVDPYQQYQQPMMGPSGNMPNQNQMPMDYQQQPMNGGQNDMQMGGYQSYGGQQQQQMGYPQQGVQTMDASGYGYGNDPYGNGSQMNMQGYPNGGSNMNASFPQIDNNLTRELFGKIDSISNMLRNHQDKIDQQTRMINRNYAEQERLQSRLTKLVDEPRDFVGYASDSYGGSPYGGGGSPYGGSPFGGSPYESRVNMVSRRPSYPSPFGGNETSPQSMWDDDFIYPISGVVYPPRARQFTPYDDDPSLRSASTYTPARYSRRFPASYAPTIMEEQPILPANNGGSPYFGYVRSPRRRR